MTRFEHRITIRLRREVMFVAKKKAKKKAAKKKTAKKKAKRKKKK